MRYLYSWDYTQPRKDLRRPQSLTFADLEALNKQDYCLRLSFKLQEHCEYALSPLGASSIELEIGPVHLRQYLSNNQLITKGTEQRSTATGDRKEYYIISSRKPINSNREGYDFQDFYIVLFKMSTTTTNCEPSIEIGKYSQSIGDGRRRVQLMENTSQVAQILGRHFKPTVTDMTR